jgi:hypothetical protein
MKILLFTLLTLLLISCGKDEPKPDKNELAINNDNPSALNVPDGFDYKMDRDIQFNLQVLDHNGTPGKFIGIRIYEPSDHQLSSNETAIPNIASSAVLIFSGQTNSMGYLEETVLIPMHLESVQIQASQLGINNLVTLNLNNDVIFHEFK